MLEENTWGEKINKHAGSYSPVNENSYGEKFELIKKALEKKGWTRPNKRRPTYVKNDVKIIIENRGRSIGIETPFFSTTAFDILYYCVLKKDSLVFLINNNIYDRYLGACSIRKEVLKVKF